jgi:aryl-alcohol dehydrogenase-like predicted oxidoreductase
MTEKKDSAAAMQNALNEQINAEMYSSYLYLAMAAYFDSVNLPGCAAWMKAQAKEEENHAMKFYHNIVERGGRVMLKAIAQPPAEWKSPLDVFSAAYKHEQHVTDRINKLVQDMLDYSRARVRASLDESAGRLGVDYFDIIHIHDIEYQGRKYTEWALTEGYEAVQELKREGRIGGVSFGIYPMDLWKRIFASLDIDAALVHNHYCLNDTQLLDLLPMARQKGIGIVNGSPFASGLLTDRGAPAWHPAGLRAPVARTVRATCSPSCD